uniref:Uncharacterized protein n=1 Tax=Guillardia theta TaxID=55529 RepID=A0A7S4P9P2_GUITH|mmetsp:Transcript_46160/g.144790  ORF Transcript_46160/g.144790 Transcript_46160/m.144790 type:complete len:215 (+) Transcript_46160:244-888(+)
MAAQEKFPGTSNQQFHEPLSDSGEEYSPSRAQDDELPVLEQEHAASTQNEKKQPHDAGMEKELPTTISTPVKDDMLPEGAKAHEVPATDEVNDTETKKRGISDISAGSNGTGLKRQKSPVESSEGAASVNSPSSYSTPASKKPRLTFGFGLRSVEKVVKPEDEPKANGEDYGSSNHDVKESWQETSEKKRSCDREGSGDKWNRRAEGGSEGSSC